MDELVHAVDGMEYLVTDEDRKIAEVMQEMFQDYRDSLNENALRIAQYRYRIRAEARAEAMKDAVARARDYCDEILMWNDDAQDGIEAAILADEPKEE